MIRKSRLSHIRVKGAKDVPAQDVFILFLKKIRDIQDQAKGDVMGEFLMGNGKKEDIELNRFDFANSYTPQLEELVAMGLLSKEMRSVNPFGRKAYNRWYYKLTKDGWDYVELFRKEGQASHN